MNLESVLKGHDMTGWKQQTWVTIAVLVHAFVFTDLSMATESAGGKTKKPPNLVFIFVDDMGYGDLSCYGGKAVKTKNIDKLASEGIHFTQFYVASPICSPSRVGVLTGMFPARWKINSFLQSRKGNQHCEQVDWLDPQALSLARVLQMAGYATAHIGKWHLGGGRDVKDAPLPKMYGFDEGVVSSHPLEGMGLALDPKLPRWKTTAAFVDKALDFIQRHKNGSFFVNLWLMDTHDPFVPSAKAADAKKPLAREHFLEVLAELDVQMGRLLDGLKKLGVEDNTLVIFTSDNGPNPSYNHERTGGLRGQKWSLYEGGIRVPFIARWPGLIPAGKTNDTTVLASVDLFPTLCRLMKVAPPKGVKFDGEDLSAAFLGKTPERTKTLYWEYGRKKMGYLYPKNETDRSPNVGIREGKWILLVNDDGTGAELYDILQDPRQTKNLVSQQPQVTADLTKKALEWRKSLP